MQEVHHRETFYREYLTPVHFLRFGSVSCDIIMTKRDQPEDTHISSSVRFSISVTTRTLILEVVFF